MKEFWFRKGWLLRQSSIRPDHQLVPVRESADSSVAFRVVWLVLYLTTSVISFYLGVGLASEELRVINADYVETKRMYARQISELETLRREKLMVERSAWVSQRSAEELRLDLVRLGDEKQAIARELRFFRAVMDPDRAKEGVSVYSVELRATPNANRFMWRMVVAQNATLHQVQTGDLQATIHGYQGDKAVSIPMNFSSGGTSSDKGQLKFQYFQNLPQSNSWGMLNLPEGFEPVSIETVIRLTKPARKTIKNTFEWQVDEQESAA